MDFPLKVDEETEHEKVNWSENIFRKLGRCHSELSSLILEVEIYATSIYHFFVTNFAEALQFNVLSEYFHYQ